jgi:hypothetical protein
VGSGGAEDPERHPHQVGVAAARPSKTKVRIKATLAVAIDVEWPKANANPITSEANLLPKAEQWITRPKLCFHEIDNLFDRLSLQIVNAIYLLLQLRQEVFHSKCTCPD